MLCCTTTNCERTCHDGRSGVACSRGCAGRPAVLPGRGALPVANADVTETVESGRGIDCFSSSSSRGAVMSAGQSGAQ